MGGKVQREIEKNDPSNEGIKMIYKKREEGLFFEVNFSTPEKRKEEKSESAKRAAPPPPKDPPHPIISKGVVDAMGKRGWEVEKLRSDGDLFFKINKNEYEDREILVNRKEIWDWVVLCIEGEYRNLFCAHLVRECDKWDIQQLYRVVKEFLHTENYREFGQRIEKFFSAKPHQNGDIFRTFHGLEKSEEEISKLEHLAQETGETLQVPKFYKVWKVLSAVEKYPDYRVFTEKVQMYTPNSG